MVINETIYRSILFKFTLYRIQRNNIMKKLLKIQMKLLLKIFLFFFFVKTSRHRHTHEKKRDIKRKMNLEDNLVTNFDLLSSLKFIDNGNKTGCFSPFYEEMIHLCRDFHCLTGRIIKNRILKKLWKFYDLIIKISPKVLSINFSYVDNGILTQRSLNKPLNGEEVYNMHTNMYTNNYLFQSFENFLSWSLKSQTELEYKGEWAEEFQPDKNKNDVFTMGNRKEVSRLFINKSCYERNRRINIDGVVFDMIVLPISSGYLKVGHRNLMIYLIPTQLIDLTYLWKAFINYSNSKGGIKNTILDCCPSKIHLYIPKLDKTSKHTYHFNNPRFLENHTEESSTACSVKASIKISEKGKSSGHLSYEYIKIDDYDSDYNEPIIKANIPYISFLYDMRINRILMILKDNGG